MEVGHDLRGVDKTPGVRAVGTSRRRWVTSLLLGLMGLAGAFVPLDVHVAPYTISFDWSCCFPLVAALAYGPRLALVAGILGATFPFFLWPGNGWANVVGVCLFLGWFTWHGWFAARRRVDSPWWVSPFVIQAPYGVLFTGVVYLGYPLALAWNPAPWAPDSVTSMPPAILASIVSKEALAMYVALLIAKCLLRSPRVLRILDVPVKAESRNNDTILALSVAASCLMLLVLQVLDTIFITRTFPYGLANLSEPHKMMDIILIGTVGLVAAYTLIRFVERRNLAEDALAESNDNYSQVVSSLSACVWKLDLDETHRCSEMYFSEVAERLLGVPERTLDKHPSAFAPFVPAGEVAGIQQVMAEAIDNPGQRKFHECRVRRADGEIRWLVSGAIVRRSPRGRLQVFGITEDVTDQRLLEQQLVQQQKLESIGLLAGGIAHDFSNMLMPILGYADLLCREFPPGDRVHVRASVIAQAATKARELVRQLLSFSRKQVLTTQAHDLNAIIAGFFEMMRRTIPERIQIDLRLSETRCPIVADSTQVEQVLLNLAVNAQNAIAGSGVIRLETRHVVIDQEYCHLHPTAHPGLYVRLAFSDTGCGIEESTLLHIFEPFYTTRAAMHGTGLGLSTVYGIVKQHEGFLDVKSTPGGGTTFFVHLPQQEREPAAPRVLSVPDSDALRRGKVLLVEDNHLVLGIVQELLETRGFEVRAVDSSLAALDLCEREGYRMDLLVTDVVLPHLTGPELFERLQPRFPGLRVLFMSGYTGDVEMPEVGTGERAAFIAKPFTAEDLLAMIGELLPSCSAPV